MAIVSQVRDDRSRRLSNSLHRKLHARRGATCTDQGVGSALYADHFRFYVNRFAPLSLLPLALRRWCRDLQEAVGMVVYFDRTGSIVPSSEM
jgi:hypothetical protein